ncbi:MAG: MFS transporter [Oscillospiraceae bacterium]
MDNLPDNEKKPRSVLRSRNFFLLFLGTIVSNIGSTLYSFAVSFYILKITQNNALLQGIYLAVCGVVFVLFSVVGGVLADRWDKVKIVYGSDFIKGFAILISAVIIYISIQNGSVTTQLIVLFCMGILSNIIAAIFSPATSALIPAIVEQNQLQQANSLFSVLQSLQSLIGIVLAGVLYAALPITVLFAVIGICFVCSGLSEIFIKAHHVRVDSPLSLKYVLCDFREGIRYMRPQKALVTMLFGVLFVNFFLSPFISNAQPFFFRTFLADGNYLFHEFLTPEMWSSVMSVCTCLGSLLMGMILGQRSAPEKCGRVMVRWLLLTAIMFSGVVVSFFLFAQSGLSLNTHLLLSCLLLFLVGACTVNVNVPFITFVHRTVDSDKMAKVMSLTNIGSMGLTPLASFIGGVLISSLGLYSVYIFCAVGMLITAVTLYTSKNVDNL